MTQEQVKRFTTNPFIRAAGPSCHSSVKLSFKRSPHCTSPLASPSKYYRRKWRTRENQQAADLYVNDWKKTRSMPRAWVMNFKAFSDRLFITSSFRQGVVQSQRFLKTVSICSSYLYSLSRASRSRTLACWFRPISFPMMSYQERMERKLALPTNGGMVLSGVLEIYCPQTLVGSLRRDGKLFNSPYRLRSRWTTSDWVFQTRYSMGSPFPTRITGRLDASL